MEEEDQLHPTNEATVPVDNNQDEEDKDNYEVEAVNNGSENKEADEEDGSTKADDD